MEQHSNGKQIVQYLLGQLPEDKQQRLEEQLFTDEEYFERLKTTEDELIDNYLLGRLSMREREQFEKTFLTKPFLREKVNLAKALIDYIDKSVGASVASVSEDYLSIFFSRWNARKAEHITEVGAGVAWLQNYLTSLCIMAAVRVVILALLWFSIYRVTFTSSFHSPIIFYFLTTLIVLYVPLEAVIVLSSARDARLVLAETEQEIDPS